MGEIYLEGPRFEISLGDEAYPPILAETADPPERIYGIGSKEALIPGVGVIGARKATPYGLACADLVASHAAQRGLTIVSGGARGCDQAAHAAAVAAGVPTVVVFGGAANIVYPKSGEELFKNVVASGGAVISEHPWGMPALPSFFLKRNRIIAGLSMLLVIAEAGLPSGTFSTADAALEAGRIVGTVPGSILSATSKGANHLLSQGACAIVDVETLDAALDLAFISVPLSMFPPEKREDPAFALMRSLHGDPMLEALAAEAYSAGELALHFGFSVSELAKRLSHLEIQGVVERRRDGRFQVSPAFLKRQQTAQKRLQQMADAEEAASSEEGEEGDHEL